MKLKVTGDLRQVAESAWISTLNQIKAKARSDQDALKVVKFLIDNHHTSPLESVTLGFSKLGLGDERWPYIENPFAHYNEQRDKLTIDLLNFLKTTYHYQLFSGLHWKMFTEACPDLAELCLGFSPIEMRPHEINAAEQLGNEHGMEVELINHHAEPELNLSRATWRVKGPLSVLVQILRHRSGSFNQTSGRYRTLGTEMIGPVKDCQEIFEKVGLDISEYLGISDENVRTYLKAMKMAKEAKDAEKISNPEYKRFREFARFILPEGRLTEMYITFYLDYFYEHYLPLRDADDVQTEHIFVAQEMKRTLESQSGF